MGMMAVMGAGVRITLAAQTHDKKTSEETGGGGWNAPGLALTFSSTGEKCCFRQTDGHVLLKASAKVQFNKRSVGKRSSSFDKCLPSISQNLTCVFGQTFLRGHSASAG